jgi:hypothetical protein
VTVKDLYVVFTPNSRKFRQAHLRFHSLWQHILRLRCHFFPGISYPINVFV